MPVREGTFMSVKTAEKGEEVEIQISEQDQKQNNKKRVRKNISGGTFRSPDVIFCG